MKNKKPDEFYERIADLYTWHGQHGSAHFIADLYGVPLTTVHGWTRRCRERALIHPGQRTPGKPCYACGQAMTAEAIEYDRNRRSHWQRGM